MRIYESTVRFQKTMPDGRNKTVSETYLVDALSFSDAEQRTVESLSPFVTGDLDVSAIRRTPYREFIDSRKSDADKFFKARLISIVFDERTGREKRQPCWFVFRAASIEDAHAAAVSFMKSSVADWQIATLDETKIIDIFLSNG